MTTLLVLIISLMLLTPAAGGKAEAGWHSAPWGDYCDGPSWGWYGARRPVNTSEQAKKILETYYGAERLSPILIKDKGGYFEAEIKDKKGTVIDRVIVDKRSGRIRSIN